MGDTEATVPLRRAIAGVSAPSLTDSNDYRIATAVGAAFLARGRTGTPTLLIPLESVPVAAGRRGGGFVLTPAARVAFEFDGRTWEQSAATFECTDPQLVDAFLVLVLDVTRRLGATRTPNTWQALVEWVEEWQTLLARRQLLTTEQQLGLWGELWVIANAEDVDTLIAAWRGPEREATDFFLNGLSLEVKVSRQPHVHHISQRQVDEPVGANPAYLLSIWAGIDPARGVSLTELIDSMLARVTDPPALLKTVAGVGYAPVDREQYGTRFIPLEPPRWFRAQDIPRVRAADVGVSHLRYVVTLDVERAVTEDDTTILWRHFLGRESSGILLRPVDLS